MEGESPVVIIRNAAPTAKINVTKLRGNVSVLEGRAAISPCLPAAMASFLSMRA
jgi:hypothetical protein